MGISPCKNWSKSHNDHWQCATCFKNLSTLIFSLWFRHSFSVYFSGICGQLFTGDRCPAVVTHGCLCRRSSGRLGHEGTSGQALWNMLDDLSHVGGVRGQLPPNAPQMRSVAPQLSPNAPQMRSVAPQIQHGSQRPIWSLLCGGIFLVWWRWEQGHCCWWVKQTIFCTCLLLNGFPIPLRLPRCLWITCTVRDAFQVFKYDWFWCCRVILLTLLILFALLDWTLCCGSRT